MPLGPLLFMDVPFLLFITQVFDQKAHTSGIAAPTSDHPEWLRAGNLYLGWLPLEDTAKRQQEHWLCYL
jgi:hypothetical protein